MSLNWPIPGNASSGENIKESHLMYTNEETLTKDRDAWKAMAERLATVLRDYENTIMDSDEETESIQAPAREALAEFEAWKKKGGGG